MRYWWAHRERSLLQPAQKKTADQPFVWPPAIVDTAGKLKLIGASDHSTLSTRRLRPVVSLHSMLENVVSAPLVSVE